VIFDLVGAFGLSLTSFALPGIMYLILKKNERAFHEVESSRSRKCNTIGSYLLIVFCAVNIILVLVKLFV